MAMGWTYDAGELPRSRRLAALPSLLVVGGLSLALWSAIITVLAHAL
jgi:hypothetical protein